MSIFYLQERKFDIWPVKMSQDGRFFGGSRYNGISGAVFNVSCYVSIRSFQHQPE